ncbi:hypothetical protein U0070_018979 [Myodes glareolus]|uniref:Uncharacterized protein n=1 Tax=Myodes glareolus TaxID=447135 RepID=A0AAW0IUD3_MYOGA
MLSLSLASKRPNPQTPQGLQLCPARFFSGCQRVIWRGFVEAENNKPC